MHGPVGVPHHQTTPVRNDKGLHSPTLTRMVMKEYCHPELRTTPSTTSTRFERSEGSAVCVGRPESQLFPCSDQSCVDTRELSSRSSSRRRERGTCCP